MYYLVKYRYMCLNIYKYLKNKFYKFTSHNVFQQLLIQDKHRQTYEP